MSSIPSLASYAYTRLTANQRLEYDASRCFPAVSVIPCCAWCQYIGATLITLVDYDINHTDLVCKSCFDANIEVLTWGSHDELNDAYYENAFKYDPQALDNLSRLESELEAWRAKNEIVFHDFEGRYRPDCPLYIKNLFTDRQ